METIDFKELEGRLPQKNEFNYVRALDSQGNPILISKEDLASVVEGLLTVATETKSGLFDSDNFNICVPKTFYTSKWVKIVSSNHWFRVINNNCLLTINSKDRLVYTIGDRLGLGLKIHESGFYIKTGYYTSVYLINPGYSLSLTILDSEPTDGEEPTYV